MPLYSPEQLEKLYEKERAKFTDAQFFNSPSAKPFRDVWMAARFGRGYSRCIGPCQLEIDPRTPDEADDFFLHARGKRFPFQSTEVGTPGRRRGTEYREVRRPDPNANPDLGTTDAPIWIADALNAKVHRRYSHANRLNVLLYLNIPAQQLQFEAVRSACGDSLRHFNSVWAVTNLVIGCFHSDPDLGVLDGWSEIDLVPTSAPRSRRLVMSVSGRPKLHRKKGAEEKGAETKVTFSQQGLAAAARVLRALADEFEQLSAMVPIRRA
jgi:hypothetical protein